MDSVILLGSVRAWVGGRGRTWTCIRVYNGDSVLAGSRLEEALLRPVVPSACEACQIEDDGYFPLLGLSGQEEVQLHCRACRRRIVLKFQ